VKTKVRIIWLDAGPCIIELLVFYITSTLFLNFEHFIISTLIKFKNLCNNSFIRAMYVMYYTSLLHR
jgi:hypothetical protein